MTRLHLHRGSAGTPFLASPRRRFLQGLRAWAVAGAVSLGVWTGGCASTGELVAVDGSRRWVAQDPANGLTLVATTGAWTGGPNVQQAYSVIHVLIDNRGSAPVLIAPGDFQLRDRFGFLYPLYDAGGSFRRVTSNQDYVEQRDYDRGHNTPFQEASSSDPEFARAALPWGVLEPGSQIRGFLYFDKLSSHANRGTLLWQAQAPNHTPLANLGFELYVARQVGSASKSPNTP